MAKEITMDIIPGFDFIIEEGQNTSLNLRKVSWNGRDPKLDLRKWSYQEGEERAMKGITLSEEGAAELTCVLAEQGYGETKRLIRAIQNRDDYESAMRTLNDPEESGNDDGSEEYYDPAELLGGEY